MVLKFLKWIMSMVSSSHLWSIYVEMKSNSPQFINQLRSGAHLVDWGSLKIAKWTIFIRPASTPDTDACKPTMRSSGGWVGTNQSSLEVPSSGFPGSAAEVSITWLANFPGFVVDRRWRHYDFPGHLGWWCGFLEDCRRHQKETSRKCGSEF